MAKKTNKSAVSNANTDRKALIAKAAATIKAADVNLLASTALASSTSRFDLCKRALAFIGKTPTDSPTYAARHAAMRRALSLGYLAGRFRRDGDNRSDDELLAYAGTVYECAKPGAEKLSEGQRHCTEAEWLARGACRTWLSGITTEAGIVAPKASGGGADPDALAKAKAKKLKEARANPNAVIESIKSETAQAAIKSAIAKAKASVKEGGAFAPSMESVPAFVQSIERALVAYLQAANKLNAKNGGAIPPQVTSALTDCKRAIAATHN